jgi:16S rRNA G1207 methylase RsmC
MKINHISISGADVPFLVSMVEHLVHAGLYASNPMTKHITVFRKDGDPMSISSLSEINNAFQVFSGIQLWLDQSSDVYISWERINTGIDVFLDGLNKDEVVRVADLCCNFSCAYAVKKNISITIVLNNHSGT